MPGSDRVEGLGQRHLRLARLDRSHAQDHLGVARNAGLAADRAPVETRALGIDRLQVDSIGDRPAAVGPGQRLVHLPRRIGLEDDSGGPAQRRVHLTADERVETAPDLVGVEALMDRPDQGDAQLLRQLGTGDGEHRGGVDEDRLERLRGRPGGELIDPASVRARFPDRGDAGDVHRHAQRFELSTQRAVEGAGYGELDSVARNQLAQEVEQVELRSTEVELVGEDEYPAAAGPLPAPGEALLGHRRRQRLVGCLYRDRNRRQLEPLAIGPDRERGHRRLAVGVRPGGDVDDEFEAAYPSVQKAVLASQVRPGQSEPGQPHHLFPQPELYPTRRSARKQRPAGDRDRRPRENGVHRRGVEHADRHWLRDHGRLGRRCRPEAPDFPGRPEAPASALGPAAEAAHTAPGSAALSQACVRAIPDRRAIGSKLTVSRTLVVSRTILWTSNSRSG